MDDKFTITINPETLEACKINPVVISNGEIKQFNVGKAYTNRIMKKIKYDAVNISFEIKDEDTNKNIYEMLKKWKEAMEKDAEENVDRLMTYFKFDQTKGTKPTEINLVLKKPLNKLTTEEKTRIKSLLMEVTDINPSDLEKFFG